jgi:CHAT domain-containing protein
MKRIGIFLLILFFSDLKAQNWRELNDSLVSNYQQKNFSRAVIFAKQLHPLLEDILKVSSKDMLVVTRNISNAYYANEQYQKAIEYLIKIGEHLKQTQPLSSANGLVQYEIGEIYDLLDDTAMKILQFSAAEKMLKNTGGQDSIRIIILDFFAMHYFMKGEFVKATPYHQELLTLKEKQFGRKSDEYESALLSLLVIYMQTGPKTKELDIREQIINFYRGKEQHGLSDLVIQIRNQGVTYFNMGEYGKSETYLLQVLELQKKIAGDDSQEYIGALSNLALLYRADENFSVAETLANEASSRAVKLQGPESLLYAEQLANLGSIYMAAKNFLRAEPVLLTAKKIYENKNKLNSIAYGRLALDLAVVYIITAQEEKAEGLLRTAIGIFDRQGGTEKYLSGLKTLAELQLQQKKFPESEKTVQLALEKARVKGLQKTATEAGLLMILAQVYLETNHTEKALAVYDQYMGIPVSELVRNTSDYIKLLTGFAELYQIGGEPEKAEDILIKVEELIAEKFGKNNEWYLSSLLNRAAYDLQNLNYTKAGEKIIKSYELNRTLSAKALFTFSEAELTRYLDDSKSLHFAANSLLFHQHNASPELVKANFNGQLSLKSLSLSNTRNAMEAVRGSADTVLKKKYADWLKNKAILARQYNLPITARRTDIKKVEEQTEELEKELIRVSALFGDQQNILKLSASDLQSKLREEEAVVEFVRFQDYTTMWTDSIIYAAYMLTSKSAVPVFIPLCTESRLQQLIDSAGTTATAMVSHFYRGTEIRNKSTAAALGTELFKLIWQPLETYLKGIKKINYSPAGKLYSIAFHALPVDSNLILMDKYSLHQYSSTRQVALRKEPETESRIQNICLFGNAAFTLDSLQLLRSKAAGDPSGNISTTMPVKSRGGSWTELPGTAEEVKKIEAVFKEKKISTRVYTQIQASEDNLKALSNKSPQVLHIATHGFFLPEPERRNNSKRSLQANSSNTPDDPLVRSGLILSGANYAWTGNIPIEGMEDGIATAYEISQLNLSNTELVVLSACETALGDIKGNEGVFGLQRAFKMAGVKKMIVSLWQVPDKETAELMTAFYGYWLKGKTINEAFAQAQAEMRKKYSPYYWAAFVLVE